MSLRQSKKHAIQIKINNSNHNTPQKYRLKSPLPIKQLTKRSRKSDADQYENPQELHELQIKQLKRENAFLKKKLEDTLNQKRELLLEGFGIFKPKKRVINRGLKKTKKDEVQVSLQFFFREINNLITSVSEVFNICLYNHQQDQYLSKSTAIQLSKSRQPKVLKKQEIYQKLQKISLQMQESRYPALLNLFTDYYRTKSQAEKSTIDFVDSMTQKTIQLNQWLLQKVKREQQNKSQADECHKSVQLQQANYNQNLDAKSEHNYLLPQQPQTQKNSRIKRQTDINNWMSKAAIKIKRS